MAEKRKLDGYQPFVRQVGHLSSLIVGACVLTHAVVMDVKPVQAQFYKDRNVTMMLNYGVGGTTDTEGRLFARHLSRHLAGNPPVVVVNRPGAGGLIGTNQLGLATKPDGQTFGFFTMDVTPPILGDPALRFNYHDFTVIAGVSQVSIAIGRTDIPPGMARVSDIAKAAELVAGGYGPTSDVTMRMRLLLETMDVKHRIIYGYRSAGDLMKALMQNELNFLILSMSGYLTQAEANIVKTKMGLPFWYLPRSVSVDGGYKKSDLLEKRGVRAFSVFYRDAFGKAPSGLQWEAFVYLQNLTSSLRRVVVMPPGSPDAAVSELRAAFEALGEDPAFIAEYEKIVGERPELVSAQEGQAILGQLKQMRPELVTVIKSTLEKK